MSSKINITKDPSVLIDLTNEIDLEDLDVSKVYSETKENNCFEPIETNDSSKVCENISNDQNVLIDLTNLIKLENLHWCPENNS